MTAAPKAQKGNRRIIVIVIVLVLLAASIGLNIYYAFFREFDSYLQDTDEIYLMEAGILRNNRDFAEGEDYEFRYDFENEEYPQLTAAYGIDKIAGEGSEFEKALRLMNEFAPRLTHKSNYDNHVDMNAMALLEYSLNDRNCGINCRSKAQILNEMCLALGIYARKVWILPFSRYDTDCHVVNEVWDTARGKWIMLDITNNEYWVDENGTPLSVLEVRRKAALMEFCTPVEAGDSLSDLQSLRKKHIGEFLYIIKNMACIQYCSINTVGEGRPIVNLSPVGFDAGNSPAVSLQSCERQPAK